MDTETEPRPRNRRSKKDDSDPKLTVAEAARFLNLSESTLRGRIQLGIGPRHVKHSNGWNLLFPLSALIEYKR